MHNRNTYIVLVYTNPPKL